MNTGDSAAPDGAVAAPRARPQDDPDARPATGQRGTETSRSEADEPDTARFEATRTETAQSEADESETAQSEKVQAEADQSETVQSEADQSETAQSEADESDAEQPEATQFNTDEPDQPEPEDVPSYQRFDCTQGEASSLFRAADAARRAIEQGQCIVLPTDTVYGIGADAFSPDAVQRLLDAKSRGRDMPPPVLIAEANLIRVLALDVPAAAKALIDRHWPGPLTVICQAQPSLRMDLGDTEGTIALRVPDHALAREILRQTGPMAVSSANQSGRPAAVTCDQAVEQLDDHVAVYLDGGRLGTGEALPSTMVDFSKSDSGAVLRRGALSVEVLRETCPDLEDLTTPPAAVEPAPSPAEGSHPPDPGPSDAHPGDPEPPHPEPEVAGPSAAHPDTPVPGDPVPGDPGPSPALSGSHLLEREPLEPEAPGV